MFDLLAEIIKIIFARPCPCAFLHTAIPISNSNVFSFDGYASR